MIEQNLGISADYLIIGMAAMMALIIILDIVRMVKMSNLKKRYEAFMMGKEAASLEDTLIQRIEEIENLKVRHEQIEQNMAIIDKKMVDSFQKIGILKYDALEESGGKLSFALAILDAKNDGYILDCVHAREGCYTYMKEVIDGNAIIGLSPEEDEALSRALTGSKE